MLKKCWTINLLSCVPTYGTIRLFDCRKLLAALVTGRTAWVDCVDLGCERAARTVRRLCGCSTAWRQSNWSAWVEAALMEQVLTWTKVHLHHLIVLCSVCSWQGTRRNAFQVYHQFQQLCIAKPILSLIIPFYKHLDSLFCSLTSYSLQNASENNIPYANYIYPRRENNIAAVFELVKNIVLWNEKKLRQ